MLGHTQGPRRNKATTVLQEMRIQVPQEEGFRAQEDMSMSVGSAGLEGVALRLGLILALGPQNVFVLRQGPSIQLIS